MKGTPLVTDDSLDIPAKRYFTIGEVAELCGLKTHVLRYWETEFSQLNPVKRRGNRRYYQRDDVLMVRTIQHLLHEEGFTIAGARQKLNQSGGRVRRPGTVEPVESGSPLPFDGFPEALAAASHNGVQAEGVRESAAQSASAQPRQNGPSATQLREWREALESVRGLLGDKPGS